MPFSAAPTYPLFLIAWLANILLAAGLLYSACVFAEDGAMATTEEAKNKAGVQIPRPQVGVDIEVVTIIGHKSKLPGAATRLTKEDITRFSSTDSHKVLSAVPGVNFRSEEGYGLRPNIGIRGTPNERSSKITLMEDGILIAPAPYSAPSAYYFPTLGRMHGIEVVKGSSALTEGPYTIGGALNFISTPLPETVGYLGQIRHEQGSDKLMRTHANIGFKTASGFGGLIETHLHQTDGFDDIARSSGDTGFSVRDYLGKLGYEHQGRLATQQFNVKYTQTTQDSKQTYVGLTEADIATHPHRRYGLSAYDNFSSEHSGLSFSYLLLAGNFQLRMTAFKNNFSRSWFKVHDLDAEGHTAVADYASSSISKIIELANTGDVNASGILQGTQSALVRIKDNAREYNSEGLALRAQWELGAHHIKAGLRQVKDEEDRLQYYAFTQQNGDNGELSALFGQTTPSGGDNRLTQGEGRSLFAEDVMQVGPLAIRLGLRLEDYRLEERRYTGGYSRTGLADNYPREVADDAVMLWGGGLVWTPDSSKGLELFAGLHQGFSPARGGADPETADNFEIGTRFSRNQLQIEGTLFESDYTNIVGECRNSNQGSLSACDPGDAFDGGAATIKGLELYVVYTPKLNALTQLPLSLTYSHTNSQFDSNFLHNAYWGEVRTGDAIPYLPERQLTLRAGLKRRYWHVDLQRISYSKTCSVASCAAFTRIDAWHNFDLSGGWQLPDKGLSFYASVQNLTNEQDIVSRNPNNGARSQQPRTFLIGVTYEHER